MSVVTLTDIFGRVSPEDPLSLIFDIAYASTAMGHCVRLELAASNADGSLNEGGGILVATTDPVKAAKIRKLVAELDGSTVSAADTRALVLTARGRRLHPEGMRAFAEACGGEE